MSVGKRDRHTGQMTTGHEWNGIEELNTPVPKVVYVFLGLAFAFAVVYWLLMPAWPLGVTFTRGLLGVSQHSLIDADLKEAIAEKKAWTSKISNESFSQIQADPALMHIVLETARPLFGDNCAACHGEDAEGGPGFPNLTDKSSLWGRSADAVMETIRVGINSEHEDTRTSQMPAFGRDGMLDRDAINNVAAYVWSLSHHSPQQGSDAQAASAGKEIFANNCAGCHGANATGSNEIGAPNLTDKFWLYGGDQQTIFETVFNGREGHMPTWESRLSYVDRKMLALYIAHLESEGDAKNSDQSNR